jgi:hypothetical protein
MITLWSSWKIISDLNHPILIRRSECKVWQEWTDGATTNQEKWFKNLKEGNNKHLDNSPYNRSY